MNLALQGSLLGSAETTIDGSFAGARRVSLADGAWVDHVPFWLLGADELFGVIAYSVQWQSPMVTMWDKRIQQPRLSGMLVAADRPAIVEEMHARLSARDRPEATIAIVSLGGPRRFLLRPKGGGPSVRFDLASGDLLAMGGSCQRTWQHCVPKVARAEPRISLTFRHKYDD